MSKHIIKKLNSNLINQIAAGEVVDSPSSVLKELIENSIDAKSTSINVYISKGGINYIKIKDNGIGMNSDNLKNCLERFATSKINSNDDLSNITTLGFRGEALPSIASVSKFLIESKANKSDGMQIDVEYGKINDIIPSSISDGTRITVSNLFFNVPARKKFLKSENYGAYSLWNVQVKDQELWVQVQPHLTTESIVYLNWDSRKLHLLG